MLQCATADMEQLAVIHPKNYDGLELVCVNTPDVLSLCKVCTAAGKAHGGDLSHSHSHSHGLSHGHGHPTARDAKRRRSPGHPSDADADAERRAHKRTHGLGHGDGSAPPQRLHQHTGGIQVGNNILDRLKERHATWPLGGLAELLHNAREAHAEHIEIKSFLDLDVDDANFAIEINDDGHGMSHGNIEVRVTSRTIPPQWESTRFRLAPRTC